MKKSLDSSFQNFELPADDEQWVEIAKGVVHNFPQLDENVRSKLVPGRIKEAVFWRRFLWRVSVAFCHMTRFFEKLSFFIHLT